VTREQFLDPSMPQKGLIAVAQTIPKIGKVDYNLEQIEQVLISLAPSKQSLVVFPEMATTGYFVNGREQLMSLAEDVPGGQITKRLIIMAKKYKSYLVVGLPEREGKALYNSSVLIGPEGFITKYRKLHLWSEEKQIFDPGNLGLVVANLPFGRVGMMICYDLWFPEQARILRLLGADILAVSAALVWNDTPAHVKKGYYMANYVGMATAHLNQVYIALASQVRYFQDKWLFGSSFLAGPHGWLLCEPAGDQEAEVLQEEVDFSAGKRIRGWGTMDNFDQDRRIDIYGNLLGYSGLEG